MSSFEHRNGSLHAEDVSVSAIADRIDTPFYLYSHQALADNFRAFDGAFNGMPHLTCFAVKANSNLAVLSLFAKEGGGADIVSGGELFRALKAGIPADRIVFAGVGKKRSEIQAALEAGIRMFNVESREELVAINEVAGKMGAKAPIALRVNPDIDPKTHPYISTGLRKYKFGIAIEEALEHYREARTLGNLSLVGIHHHIGSQLTEVQPFADALARIVDLVRSLRAEGIDIRQIDIGGGLGIVYKDETPPHPDELAGAVLPLLDGLGCTLVLEPGRALVGNAGILVTRVLYVKRSGGKTFVIVDAAMNDLTRPSLYGAYHAIVPVRERGGRPVKADIVGPICESGDFLAKDREIPPVSSGDLLAVMSAGAYGFTMSSNYNSRPRVPEVMVRGDRFFVVRERETLDDLVRGEQVPELLLA